jgi:hypothetical protein
MGSYKMMSRDLPAELFLFSFGNNVFLGSILSCNQSGKHPKEDLAKFGYKLNMKGFKKVPSIFFGYF